MSYTKDARTLQPREETVVEKHAVELLNTGSMEKS